MPGESFSGPPLQASVRENQLSEDLSRDVHTLSVDIGERNLDHFAELERAATMIDHELSAYGYDVARVDYEVRGKTVGNIEGTKKGSTRADEVVVIGAHYDSVEGSPGGDDNASGVAAMLAIARAVAGDHLWRTIRFVGFVNEEPPYFWHDSMGSLVYARACRTRGDNIVQMISLETMGYFSDADDSQKYPFPLGSFYPSEGNFIAFVGNTSARDSVRDAIGTFRNSARVPSEGGVYPGFLPGIGWSDQWSFWQAGYPGIMITDTAPFRNPNYHTAHDLPPSMDFDRFAREVEGVIEVVRKFASP
jgi:Zn-dependent M28 family amino/carboxypeptidase